MKKFFYTLVVAFLSTFLLHAQLPAIGGPGTLSSRNYKYRLKSFIEHRSDTPALYRYVYDKDGYINELLISTEFDTDQKRTRYVYNDKKQLVERVTEKGLNFEINESKNTYEYDDAGRLIRSIFLIWFEEEYVVFSQQSYEYEGASTTPNAITNETIDLRTQTRVSNTISLEYNAQQKITKILNKLTANGSFRNSSTINYDEQNRPSKLKVEVVDQGTGEKKTVTEDFVYEENGSITKTGTGDFINYIQYDETKKGSDTYFPTQYIDFFAMTGGNYYSIAFLYRMPYEGLAHQVTRISSTNGVGTPAEPQYDFEYEATPSDIAVDTIEKETSNCKFHTLNGELFAEISEELLNKEYHLYDSLGAIQSKGIIKTTSLSLGRLTSGVYILSIEGQSYKVIL